MTVQQEMQSVAHRARVASRAIASLSSNIKNELLRNMATALEAAALPLITENRKDVEAGRQNGLSDAMLDRLVLDATLCLRLRLATPWRVRGQGRHKLGKEARAEELRCRAESSAGRREREEGRGKNGCRALVLHRL